MNENTTWVYIHRIPSSPNASVGLRPFVNERITDDEYYKIGTRDLARKRMQQAIDRGDVEASGLYIVTLVTSPSNVMVFPFTVHDVGLTISN